MISLAGTLINVFLIIPLTYYFVDLYGIYGFGMAATVAGGVAVTTNVIYIFCHPDLKEAA